MSIRSGVVAVAALAIFGVCWTSPAAAQAAQGCTGGGKISKQIAKQMAAAQDAMKAKKWQEVLNKVKDAEAVPGSKTQTDLFWMSEFRGYAYHELKQDSDAARELENGLNSPCMPESKKLDRYKSLVGIYTAQRNYAKAIDYGNRALKITKDPEMQIAVAQAYYQSGDNKDSVRVMNELLGSMEQKGTTPKEQQLLLVQAACQKAGDNACVAKMFEKLVINYPKPDYWLNLMTALRKTDTDDLQKLNVLRLSQHVKVLKDKDEYKEFAQLALDEKLACEAQTVLEQGFATKAFVEQRDIDVNNRLLTKSKADAAAQKAALPQAEAAAKASPTGDADVKVGAQYLMCGDATKGIEAIQRGIAKDGFSKADPTKTAERTDEASMLLGIAELRANNKAEAAKAFNAVKRDPTMVRIAKLWLLATKS